MAHCTDAAAAMRPGSVSAAACVRLVFSMLLALLLSSYAPCRSAEAEQSVPAAGWQFEVRAVWGGGPVRSFGGAVSITNGSLEVVRNLSVQDDAVGTLRSVSNSEVVIEPHSASAFGGADLFIKGSANSELQFQWQDPSGGPAPEGISIPISQLLRGRSLHTVDARGTRLAIERQVHDKLRARLNRGQTVFTVGEPCSLTVEGYANELPHGEYRVNVRLLEEATKRSIANLQRDVDVDEHGCFAAQTFSEIEIPSCSGVYCFEIGVQRKRLINSFINAIAVANRKLEFVVTDNQPKPETEMRWQELSQVYPTGTSWWDSLGKFHIPNVKTLTPLVTHAARPLSSGEHARRMVGGSECMALKHGAWQAFPLPIESVGSPHRVRIKMPCDQPQRLVFSIQEASTAVDSAGLRLDSGTVIEPSSIKNDSFVTHELVFWPKTLQPYLLVLNADPIKDAALAEVDLDVAPTGLNELQLENGNDSARGKRLNSLYFDKPLLAENFGAVRRLDTKGQRELDSWQTSYEASTRLADYTAWSGFNTATVTIATQGGAIYPSQILAPSPKFDSGTFLSDGSCPDIKDVTELICREFDRRDLKLVLALDIEGRLPQLERENLGAKVSDSLYQVDLDGNVARAEVKLNSAGSTHYNPLDVRVQGTLSRIVREVAQRYAHHPCFAGVQLNLSEMSHFNFAGDRWGFDAASMARLERSLGAPLPADPIQRHQFLSGTLRSTFVTERAAQLAHFYSQLATELTKSRADAKLLINPSRLLAAPPVAENFLAAQSQTLGTTEVLLSCGIDCAALAANDSICVLRPETDSPLRSPVARAWSFQLASDAELDAVVTGKNSGAIIHQIPIGFRLPDFDKANAFANQNQRTWLFPHVSSAGDSARRAFIARLFSADSLIVASGGWLVPMGQEVALRPMLDVLDSLPPVTMNDVALEGTAATLRVRQAEYDGQSFFQIINNASWQQTVVLHLQVPRSSQLHVLGDPATEPRGVQAGEVTVVELDLQPYSLVGLRVESTAVRVVSATSTPEARLAEKMERRLAELQTCIDRAGELNEQQTLGLRGTDFETWTPEGNPEGWTISSHPNTSVTQEHELPHGGNTCVRLENRGNGAATAWVQSDRIAIPTTGRLALEVWARSATGSEQPTVRLSLIGRYRDGKRFLRWHEFSSTGRERPQIPIDWGRRPLVLLVPDVPNEELTELYVAIDLIGPGRVWLDDVRVYGMYLHAEEKVHLLGQMFLAKEQIRKGDFALADQLLESFWATFLLTYLTPQTPTASGDSVPVANAKGSDRSGSAVPSWRSSSQPRFNQWQESLRQRWQR